MDNEVKHNRTQNFGIRGNIEVEYRFQVDLDNYFNDESIGVWSINNYNFDDIANSPITNTEITRIRDIKSNFPIILENRYGQYLGRWSGVNSPLPTAFINNKSEILTLCREILDFDHLIRAKIRSSINYTISDTRDKGILIEYDTVYRAIKALEYMYSNQERAFKSTLIVLGDPVEVRENKRSIYQIYIQYPEAIIFIRGRIKARGVVTGWHRLVTSTDDILNVMSGKEPYAVTYDKVLNSIRDLVTKKADVGNVGDTNNSDIDNILSRLYIRDDTDLENKVLLSNVSADVMTLINDTESNNNVVAGKDNNKKRHYTKKTQLHDSTGHMLYRYFEKTPLKEGESRSIIDTVLMNHKPDGIVIGDYGRNLILKGKEYPKVILNENRENLIEIKPASDKDPDKINPEWIETSDSVLSIRLPFVSNHIILRRHNISRTVGKLKLKDLDSYVKTGQVDWRDNNLNNNLITYTFNVDRDQPTNVYLNIEKIIDANDTEYKTMLGFTYGELDGYELKLRYSKLPIVGNVSIEANGDKLLNFNIGAGLSETKREDLKNLLKSLDIFIYRG